MYKNFNPHTPYFYSVAMALIVIGAAFVAIGGVEWILNELGTMSFSFPAVKIIGGLVVAALGYIHLELELIRISRKS